MISFQTGRTEKVRNNLNPVFGTGVEIPYIFEKQTFCKVRVIDDDSDGLANDADNLGEAEFTLGQVRYLLISPHYFNTRIQFL